MITRIYHIYFYFAILVQASSQNNLCISTRILPYIFQGIKEKIKKIKTQDGKTIKCFSHRFRCTYTWYKMVGWRIAVEIQDNLPVMGNFCSRIA